MKLESTWTKNNDIGTREATFSLLARWKRNKWKWWMHLEIIKFRKHISMHRNRHFLHSFWGGDGITKEWNDTWSQYYKTFSIFLFPIKFKGSTKLQGDTIGNYLIQHGTIWGFLFPHNLSASNSNAPPIKSSLLVEKQKFNIIPFYICLQSSLVWPVKLTNNTGVRRTSGSADTNVQIINKKIDAYVIWMNLYIPNIKHVMSM